MTSTSNTVSEYINNTELKNKGFILLDTMFKENGWYLCKNEINWICYTKMGFETDVFEIRIDKKDIHVGIPMKNSPFKFITSFKEYFLASEYLENRFNEFIK